MTTAVVTLVVNKVRNSASPAARDREQFVREERVAQRLVEEGARGRGAHPLYEKSVHALFREWIYMVDLLSRCSGGENPPRSFLAVHPSVSVSHDVGIYRDRVGIYRLTPL